MLWRGYLPQALLLLCTLALWLSPTAKSTDIKQEYEYRSIQLPVSQFYDNVATSDFDGNGAGYPFALPKWGNERPDNFISNTQVLDVKPGFVREFHVLYAGDWINGESGAQFEFEFEDSTKQVVELSVKNWWNLHWLNSGPVRAPYHNTPSGPNYNTTQLHHWASTVSSFSPLKSIRFPPRTNQNRLHIFAVTLVPAYAPDTDVTTSPPAVSVKDVRLTTLKTDKGDSVVQVTLANLRALAAPSYRFTSPHGSAAHIPGHRSPRRPVPDDQRLLSQRRDDGAHEYQHYTTAVLSGPHEVLIRAVYGQGVRTTSPGKFFRLMPGDDVRVDVGVSFDQSSEGLGAWFRAAAQAAGIPKSVINMASISRQEIEIEVLVVSASTNAPVVKSTGWDLDLAYSGMSDESGDYWQATRESLERHEAPRWWTNAKFGIFIHWGIFSVPGWAPKGPYAEWYDWWYHNPPDASNPFWNYHRETYGVDKVYDDFISEFTGAKFDAAEWVDLFATAGAKYFVLVTKHHDGFALFDTQDTSHRSSVYLGPKRDFIGELMKAARERHPEMRKGTYFSMPEWFNPDAGPYGFGSWPGHLATNPYDGSTLEPYTGRLEGKDYLKDIQEEQMRILTEEYETEIMRIVGDIGGPNRTLEFASEWYNKAAKAGKQVTINNRCGVAPDFDTPEYTRFSSIQTRNWETSEGIDPLLNLGPTGEGEIIPAMVERLVDVGNWLKHSGSCVYDTVSHSGPRNWPAADRDPTFSVLSDIHSLEPTWPSPITTTPTSFCVISFNRPTDNLWSLNDLYQSSGRYGHMLGAEKVGPLAWSYRDGKLAIIVPDEALDAVKHAWAFKISYADVE
ncbi:alpha-L-fucosidase [Ceratobasidium sp. AG-Ba]|nr:alpha-L-fucosidase [Ceratobasidium sp. AG-Ba]